MLRESHSPKWNFLLGLRLSRLPLSLAHIFQTISFLPDFFFFFPTIPRSTYLFFLLVFLMAEVLELKREAISLALAQSTVGVGGPASAERPLAASTSKDTPPRYWSITLFWCWMREREAKPKKISFTVFFFFPGEAKIWFYRVFPLSVEDLFC